MFYSALSPQTLPLECAQPIDPADLMCCSDPGDWHCEWREESINLAIARSFHSSVYSDKQNGTHSSNYNSVWIFGGLNDHANDGRQGAIGLLEMISLTNLDGKLTLGLAITVAPLGTSPEARFGHSCTQVGRDTEAQRHRDKETETLRDTEAQRHRQKY